LSEIVIQSPAMPDVKNARLNRRTIVAELASRRIGVSSAEVAATPILASSLQTAKLAMIRPTTIYQPPALGRVSIVAALRRLGQFADLFITLSIHRVRVRYKQSRLGILWAVLQPLAMMLAFTLMFAFLRTGPSASVPFPLFAYSALIPWTMFSSGLTNASGALTAHAALLTRVAFPREILPLTYVVAACVDMAIASVVLVGLMWWFGVSLTAASWWSVAAVALLIGFLVGLGLFLSALHVRHRDIGLAMPVLMQVWLFATPVLYPLAAVRTALSPPLYTLYALNPMAAVVDTFRRAVVLQQAPDLFALGTAALVVAAIVPAAYLYFKYVELTMADVV
jgi:homopolymeric O-antigen transport system permease protein